MATTEQIKATIAQATAFFKARDEVAVLEQAISRIIEDGLDQRDWSYLAGEIIDAVRCITADARDGDALSIERLRSRLQVIESLPDAWWDQSHAIYPFLAEFVDERRDLRWLFDEFDDVIAKEGYATLHPDHAVGAYVLRLVCERSGIEVRNLDPALRASINKNALIKRFKDDGGILRGVELLGGTWLLGH